MGDLPDLPIVCTLSPAELGERSRDLLPGLLARAEERCPRITAGPVWLEVTGPVGTRDSWSRCWRRLLCPSKS